MVNIGIDVMSGDRSPKEIILGAIEALKKYSFHLHLVGDANEIKRSLDGHPFPVKRLHFLPSTEVIQMDESPVEACRQKKDSSLMVGLDNLDKGLIDAFISPGNTGATLAGALRTVGRLKGVKRPAIAVSLPTKKGQVVLLDGGANMDCQVRYLRQFAVMGVTYFHYLFKTENPRLAVLNIGEEESKGNELTIKTFRELKRLPYQFVGNMEPADLIEGRCDVVVCDGFVGNVLLKSYESIAKFFLHLLKNVSREKWSYAIGVSLLQRRFKNMRDKWNVGAAPLLGVAKPVFISHGNSDSASIQSAVKTALDYMQQDINHHLETEIREWG